LWLKRTVDRRAHHGIAQAAKGGFGMITGKPAFDGGHFVLIVVGFQLDTDQRPASKIIVIAIKIKNTSSSTPFTFVVDCGFQNP
jgi:hypothetical protein